MLLNIGATWVDLLHGYCGVESGMSLTMSLQAVLPASFSSLVLITIN